MKRTTSMAAGLIALLLGSSCGSSASSPAAPDRAVEGRGSTYAVDPVDAAISEQRDGFVTGVEPRGIAFGAGGRFAYVANSGDRAPRSRPRPGAE